MSIKCFVLFENTFSFFRNKTISRFHRCGANAANQKKTAANNKFLTGVGGTVQFEKSNQH